MASTRLNITPGEGFLPHFTVGFLDRYGPTSEFVRAVADHFTLRFVGIVESSGEYVDPTTIARHSDEVSIAALRELLDLTDKSWLTFYREALGTLPLGASSANVDAALGVEAFSNWLVAFQAREHKRCSEIIRAQRSRVVA
jgi:hypothetical protein